MTYAPASLLALQQYWTSAGGTALGIVGDAAHTTGYHLGRDRIYAPRGRGDDDYSVRATRDRAGLSEAAAAIDLGHPDLRELRAFTHWLLLQIRAGASGTEDIREIIYSPDGLNVLCWDRERGFESPPIREGNDSHLWHTHISYYRDTIERDKILAVRGYFDASRRTQGDRRWASRPLPTPSRGHALAGGEQ